MISIASRNVYVVLICFVFRSVSITTHTQVRLRIYEDFDGDIYVAVRPLTRSLIKEMYTSTASSKKMFDELNVDSSFRKNRTFAPRCLVLLSQTRHSAPMKKFLKQLYATSISTGVDISLEQIVSNFVLNTFYPRPGCEVVIRWRGTCVCVKYLASILLLSTTHTNI